MSVTFPGYLPRPYPIATQNPFPASPFQTPAVQGYSAAFFSTPAISTFASNAPAQDTLSTAARPAATSGATVKPNTLPSLPQTRQQLLSLAKAAALITPAILLARVPSSKVVEKELLPSDWKVWAKMGLSVASLSQVNKALNWNPPPWLSAWMNVGLMTMLMRHMGGSRGKVMLFVGASVAALAQLNHYASEKLKGPLQQKYNISPWATDLGLSIASMGFGVFAMPRWLAPLFTETKATNQGAVETQAAAHGAKPSAPRKADVAVMAPACPAGCCASPICLNEVVNNVSLASEGIKKQLAENKGRQR